MKIAKVAVVGAGNMGSGIAQKLATEGLPVVLVDSSAEFAERGKARIEKLLVQGLDRGLFKPDQVDAILERVTPTGDLAATADVDLVIEAVFEDLKVKQDLFRRLGETCRADTVLATNTSSFLVGKLAEVTAHPERVIGLHFFYHPAKNRLVEVIGHAATQSELLQAAWKLMEVSGKTPIASADAPGFVVNRFFVPWLNEAVRLHEEGHSIATIEQVAKASFGIGMGPFQLMNVTGVPITLHAARSLADSLGDFYAPSPAIGLQVANETPWQLEGEVDPSAADAISDRLWGVVFHVALQLVSEGVGSIDDVDIGARVGLRWPVGPFEMMNTLGLAKTTELVGAIAGRYELTEPTALKAQRDARKPFTLERVRLEVQDGIATVRINRPDKLGALDPETVRQLDERFSEAEERNDVRAIVLAGTGKAFVAGADVKFFVDNIRAGDLDTVVQFAAAGQKLFRRIEQSKKRVVCRLHGMALGGGAELALACHVIVASDRASMGFPETGIGIYPGLGGTQRLSRRIGKGMARYLIYSGKTLKAADLAALKLAWRVVPAEQLDAAVAAAITEAPVQEAADLNGAPTALRDAGRFLGSVSVMDLLDGSLTLPGGPDVTKLAGRIRSKAPLAIRKVEQLTAMADTGELDAGLEAETAGLRSIFATKDALEGMTAMLERRRPQFVGA